MPKRNVRVEIPTDPTERIALLKKVSDKHTALGAGSPLGNLKWDKISVALADAKTHDDNATDLSKQIEKEYRARDVDMPTVTQALRDAREILLGTYSDNPKTLGDFSFVVNDSPRSAAKAKTEAGKATS